MLTMQDALSENEFHVNGCVKTTGPRGGIKYTMIYRYFRNGRTKTWKTRPNDFRVPVKHGMGYSRSDYGYITHNDVGDYHTRENCPLSR